MFWYVPSRMGQYYLSELQSAAKKSADLEILGQYWCLKQEYGS